MNRRVLVVDDATTVRLFHREILEEAGYEVTEAVNGLEALERLAEAPQDLLIVDVNMPQMDGYSLLNEVRRNGDHKATPAIMVTTEEEESDFRQSFAAGANLHLVKPVLPADFTEYVNLLSGAEPT